MITTRLEATWLGCVPHTVMRSGFAAATGATGPTAEQFLAYRRALCRGYLQALKRPAEEEDVFALLLDVERCSLRFVHPMAAGIRGETATGLTLPSLHGFWIDAVSRHDRWYLGCVLLKDASDTVVDRHKALATMRKP